MESTNTTSPRPYTWHVLFLLALAVFIVTTVAIQIYQAQMPIRVLAKEIPDAAKVGSVEESIAQMQELLRVYKNSNWNLGAVAARDDLTHLADARFAENEMLRKGAKVTRGKQTGMCSFTFYASENGVDDVAFFTQIYVRENASQYRGEYTRNNPAGFYLVAFKNGDIKQVSVEDARLIVQPGTTRGLIVFPGMRAYDPDALPSPAFAPPDKDKLTPRQAAMMAKLVKRDCSECKK